MVGVCRTEIKEDVDELKTLMHQQNQTGDKERIQMLYLLKSEQVPSVTQAAEILGRSRGTLQRWLAKYKQNGLVGLLERSPRLGRMCQIPEAVQAQLIEQLSTPEGFGSYGEIQAWLEQEHQHVMGYKGVHKHVRYRLQAKLKRPRPRSTEQDAEKVAFFKPI